jgi:iron complex outermembrane receptor protein
LQARDERTLTTRNAAGVITSKTESFEPSPSIYYARLTQGW